MSSKSNDQGRAFEYACILELENRIKAVRSVKIDNSSVQAAMKSWHLQDRHIQNNFIRAAKAFVNTLFEAEPLILECEDNDDVAVLSINRDADAERGDVRDIVISRNKIQWDVGLSMKHNHFAARHSRLSGKIDFGAKWYGVPCDKTYWKKVIPLFEYLTELKKNNLPWRDMTDKEQKVYVPLLEAFMSELNRAYEADNTITEKLMSYLLGIRDFYKVVAIDKKQITEFQTFNLRGELNCNGKKKKATLFVPIAELPNEIIKLRFKPNSTNTLELYMNNGWALSFRIHNASTIVEPSLKFDIQFVGVPRDIITINCSWK